MKEALQIDPEFEAKILPLTEDEYRLLEENILYDGVLLNPLIVWNGYIVDGHNRFRIIQKHPEIEYTVFEKEFSDRYAAISWICRNQLGRRNLTPQQKKYLIGQRYEAEKQADRFHGNQYTSREKSGGSQNENDQKTERTCERIARENNVNRNTVIRAENYAKGVDAADEVEPGIKQELLSGMLKPTDTAVAAIAKADPEERPALVGQLRQPKPLPEKEPEPEPVSPARPMTERQKILEISTGMETAGELADESTMFYELEDAVSTMIRRCLRCFESYPGLLTKKLYRRKVFKIFTEITQFIQKIEEE